jgi:hypothetical protein
VRVLSLAIETEAARVVVLTNRRITGTDLLQPLDLWLRALLNIRARSGRESEQDQVAFLGPGNTPPKERPIYDRLCERFLRGVFVFLPLITVLISKCSLNFLFASQRNDRIDAGGANGGD